jgi:hypothetical protein
MGGAARDPTNCGLLRDAVFVYRFALAFKINISVTCDYFIHDFMHNEQKNRNDGFLVVADVVVVSKILVRGNLRLILLRGRHGQTSLQVHEHSRFHPTLSVQKLDLGRVFFILICLCSSRKTISSE